MIEKHNKVDSCISTVPFVENVQSSKKFSVPVFQKTDVLPSSQSSLQVIMQRDYQYPKNAVPAARMSHDVTYHGRRGLSIHLGIPSNKSRVNHRMSSVPPHSERAQLFSEQM